MTMALLPFGVERLRTGPSPPVPARQTAPVAPPTGAVACPGPVGGVVHILEVPVPRSTAGGRLCCAGGGDGARCGHGIWGWAASRGRGGRGVGWPDLARLRGAVDGPDLMARLPGSDGVSVLAHGRDGIPPPGPEALAAVVVGLAAARRDGGPDLVVVDASRERTVGSDLTWWPCVDLVVVVAGTGVLELAALSSVVAALDGLDADAVLVLRGERVPGRLCDDVEDSLGLPVLLIVAHDPKLAEASHDPALWRVTWAGGWRRAPHQGRWLELPPRC